MSHPDEPQLPGLDAPPTDRLLFDFPLPPEAAARAVDQTKRAQVTHRLWGKPIPAERLRIMVAFLGDYAGLPADIVRKALAAGDELSFKQFALKFDSQGSLSGFGRHRPFGLRTPDREAGPFNVVQNELFRAMARNGLDRRTTRFPPCITLLYDMNVIPDGPVSPIDVHVDSMRLTHVNLGSSQVRVLREWTAESVSERPLAG